ncbi:MAG: AAA family ATPase [Anaerolineae bacterium]
MRDPNSQAVLYERDTGIPGMFAAPSLADGIANQPIGDATRLRTDVLADYAVFAPNTPTLRGMEADIRQRIPVGLAGGQLAEAVQELLEPRQGKFGALDLDRLLELLDWVNEIAVVPPSRELTSASVPTTRSIIRFTDRWMGRDRNQLSAYDASEGALYVLFALVLALHPHSPRLFAIENLDQNMHPRLARATVRLFCELMLKAEPERQVLLTTHNPLVLDSLNLRDDRIRLFTVERDVEGTTRVDRVPVSDEMLRVIENGLSLSNLWVMGRLGGVPDLF